MYLPGSDTGRPDYAVIVVVLLDHGGSHPGDADAVAAHDDLALLALLVQKPSPHGSAVLDAELKDVADLDGAGALQRPAAL